MESENKTALGKLYNWLYAIGGLFAVMGLIRLMTGVWTAASYIETGQSNVVASLIYVGVGALLAVIGYVLKKRET